MSIFVKLKEGKKFLDFIPGKETEWKYPFEPKDYLFEIEVREKKELKSDEMKKVKPKETNKKIIKKVKKKIKK